MERTYTGTWEDPLSIQKAARRMGCLEVMEAIGAGQLPPPPSALRLGMVRALTVGRGEVLCEGTSTCPLLRSKASPTGEVAS